MSLAGPGDNEKKDAGKGKTRRVQRLIGLSPQGVTRKGAGACDGRRTRQTGPCLHTLFTFMASSCFPLGFLILRVARMSFCTLLV